MALSFHVTELVLEGQHIREYPRAKSSSNTPPKICIKKYTPVDNPNPQPGDITIVAAQGTGYPKELYEPLWEDLIAQAGKINLRIRAIWMADAFNQGASGILNEETLGNDPSWYDHSRDLIRMINCFNQEMPQPIIGVGHSLGAAQLVFASLFHPRLFTSLVFMEPYIDTGYSPDIQILLRMSTLKKDTWPSRAIAVEKARRVFKQWDPRVFEQWAKHGYRDLPTSSHSANGQGVKETPPVTLATSKHQETLLYGRLSPNEHGGNGFNNHDAGRGWYEPTYVQKAAQVPGMQGPDWHIACRSEAVLSAKMVVYLRPSVLYLSGSRSEHCRNGIHEKLAKRTGTAFSTDARTPPNSVKHIVMEKGTHSLPQEEVKAIAEIIAPWLHREVQQWQKSDRMHKGQWEGQFQSEKSAMPLEWMLALGRPESKL